MEALNWTDTVMPNFWTRFHLVVISSMLKEEVLFEINEQCRKANTTFILGLSLGLFVAIFVDMGEKHIVTDGTGEEVKNYPITNIDPKGIITIHTDKETIGMEFEDEE